MTDELRAALAEALVALGPGTIDEMAWSHHKWVMGDLYYIVVEDERGSPVPDDYPMASLAGAILAALAARGYRLVPEPAPDVEGLDVERLAREAFDKTMEHVEPWASGPVSAKHGALFVRNLRAALHPADPSRREP